MRTVKYTALHSGKATFGRFVEVFLVVISGGFFQIILDHQQIFFCSDIYFSFFSFFFFSILYTTAIKNKSFMHVKIDSASSAHCGVSYPENNIDLSGMSKEFTPFKRLSIFIPLQQPCKIYESSEVVIRYSYHYIQCVSAQIYYNS